MLDRWAQSLKSNFGRILVRHLAIEFDYLGWMRSFVAAFILVWTGGSINGSQYPKANSMRGYFLASSSEKSSIFLLEDKNSDRSNTAITSSYFTNSHKVPSLLTPPWVGDLRYQKYNWKIANLTRLPRTGERASIQLAFLNGLMSTIKRDKQISHLTHQATVLPARITLRRLSRLPPSSVVRLPCSRWPRSRTEKKESRTKTIKDYMKETERKQDSKKDTTIWEERRDKEAAVK